MKKVLFTLTFLLALAVVADPSVFYTQNFDTYSNGNIIPQLGEDGSVYLPANQPYFTYEISSEYGTTKALHVTKNPEGGGLDSGVWFNTGAPDSYFTETGIMRFRFKLNCCSNLGGFIIGNGSSGVALRGYINGGTFYLKNANEELKFSMSQNRMYDWEINISLPSRRVTSIILDGTTNIPDNFVCANVKMTHIGGAALTKNFVANNTYHSAIDDIEVAYESLNYPVPSIAVDPVLVGRNQATYELSIANNGGGEFGYTVSALNDPEWISFNTTGNCKTTTKHKFTFDRSIMGNGFYRTIITVTADGGETFNIPFNVRSGLVFYQEDFEPPFISAGELHGQQGWNGKDTSKAYVQEYNRCEVTTPSSPWSGQCANFQISAGSDGYNYKVWTPSNLIIKVSAKMCWNPKSGSDADRFYFSGIYWRNPAYFDFWYNAEASTMGLWSFNDASGYPLGNELVKPIGEWYDISYTMDFRLQRMTEFTFGDITTNYTEKTLRKKNNERIDPMYYFEALCLRGGNEENAINVMIDDLLITEVERPKIAIPVVDAAVSVGGLDKATNVMQNGGATNFRFTATLLDEAMAPYVKLSRTSGTIGTRGVVIYNINRTGLEDGYYSARIKYDWEATSGTNSGSFVQLVSFGVGGWYYATDFDTELFHEGNIDRQECWRVSTATQNPEITVYDDLRTLYFDQAAKVTVNAPVPAESQYSFRALVNFPDNNNTTYVKFSQINDKGFLPIYLRRDRDSKELVLYYIPSGEEDPIELYRDSLLDKWVLFTFNMDLDLATSCLTEVSLGNYVRNFEEGEVPLNADLDGKSIDKFIIDANNDGPTEERDTGFYIKSVVVCDATLPEPAILSLFGILGLALLRKRS